MAGDPLDIGRLETRRIILAAIGATKTVDPLERFFMQLGQLPQDPGPFRRFVRFVQEPLILLLPGGSLLLPILQQITHISAKFLINTRLTSTSYKNPLFLLFLRPWKTSKNKYSSWSVLRYISSLSVLK